MSENAADGLRGRGVVEREYAVLRKSMVRCRSASPTCEGIVRVNVSGALPEAVIASGHDEEARGSILINSPIS